MPNLMSTWWEKWDLHADLCPCDVHFNEWVEARKITGRTIYHFGTGTHHIVGRRQAELGNAVLGITASKEEHASYVALVMENAHLAKTYLCYFGDIYLANAGLLPPLDVVTMFHLCEYSTPAIANADYGGLTDRAVVDLFTTKTSPGGFIVFYVGSRAFDNIAPIIAAWENEHPVERAEDFKTLRIYRKIR